jgi:UDP-N-acetylmuramoylalanine--D-glutamate ligase
MNQPDLSKKRVVVMGLGRFGGGVGVSRYLVGRGARVLVTDLLPADQLRDSLTQLRGLGGFRGIRGLPIEFRLGEHREEDFTAADLIVVNPAVDPRHNRYLQAARQAGVPFTTEIRLLVAALPNQRRTIGVTGTAGKSTVTSMIGHALQHCLSPQGTRVHVGGNLGGSLLDRVQAISPEDWVVLELSSFMLEALGEDHWSPHVALVTNISGNHLDRHGTMQAYAAAKQQILEHQRPGDHVVLGPGVERWLRPQVATATRVDRAPAPPLELLIPGQHNQLNAAIAIAATTAAAGIEPPAAAIALKSFPGLPHRLQLVGTWDSVRYFNDSKATTPEAAQLAIRSFEPQTVHVILGGYDKKSDLTALAHFAARRCRAVYTVGATGDAIAQAVQSAGGTAVPCGTVERAVEEARKRARPGEVVLLSPGCASWDQFENYEKRGQAFLAAAAKS